MRTSQEAEALEEEGIKIIITQGGGEYTLRASDGEEAQRRFIAWLKTFAPSTYEKLVGGLKVDC